MQFTDQSMQEIIGSLSDAVASMDEGDVIAFDVLDPDEGKGYAGEEVVIDGKSYIYRGYKSWVGLAELLKCKMLTPHSSVYPFVSLHFEKLQTDSFHTASSDDRKEKYGTESDFFTIRKMEEPSFLYYYTEALENVKIASRRRVLDLGVNRGDEFEVIKNLLDIKEYQAMELVGIDHSESAIAYAKTRFDDANVSFVAEDINALDSLGLERFDLIISIGTLQSPGIRFKPFLMKLVQEYLHKEQGAMILGFPNSRWIGGEMIYGAKAPNYAMSELSLLFNDVIFAKKYLQQHKFRVTITGKEYIFLTATKIGHRED